MTGEDSMGPKPGSENEVTIFRSPDVSEGTLHEYEQVLPQPNVKLPLATALSPR